MHPSSASLLRALRKSLVVKQSLISHRTETLFTQLPTSTFHRLRLTLRLCAALGEVDIEIVDFVTVILGFQLKVPVKLHHTSA